MVDELEFATKEDLAAIEANPELKRIHQAMMAGVTKKFQSWSAEKNQLSETLNAYTETLQQWEEWRPILDSYVANPTNLQGDPDPNPNPKVKKGDNGVAALVDSFQSFQNEVKGLGQKFTEELNTQRRMFDLGLQLDDLRRTHFEKYPKVAFDANKILSIAVEKGYRNLEDAYSSVYRDDFIKNDVESQVATRLEEEKAKLRVQGEIGGATTPTHFKLPDTTPKSFSDASSGVLDEIRAGTLTKEV